LVCAAHNAFDRSFVWNFLSGKPLFWHGLLWPGRPARSCKRHAGANNQADDSATQHGSCYSGNEKRGTQFKDPLYVVRAQLSRTWQ
jgi:hypothetical protein